MHRTRTAGKAAVQFFNAHAGVVRVDNVTFPSRVVKEEVEIALRPSARKGSAAVVPVLDNDKPFARAVAQSHRVLASWLRCVWFEGGCGCIVILKPHHVLGGGLVVQNARNKQRPCCPLRS